MAELVDALVSNTSGFTSIPVRPRVWVLKKEKVLKLSPFLCCYGKMTKRLNCRDSIVRNFIQHY